MTGSADRAGSIAAVLKRARAEWSLRSARERGAERSLVWMLGSPRTGSTWLLNLLATNPRVVPIDEPGIGYHLGLFVADVMGAHPATFEESRLLLPAARAGDRQYFFSKDYEHIWRPRLRMLILSRFHAQMRDRAAEKRVEAPIAVIKEPAGSQVAEFIFSLLPASRLLFLMRDPRDVLDSTIDAVLGGSWLANQFGADGQLSAEERLVLLRAQAHRWLARTEVVQRVYDRLPVDQRYLVRYEDLRADPATVVRGVLRWLRLDVDEARLATAVEKLSFEALPDSVRGKGKFARAATPGLWRENLTADEQALIHDTIGDVLAKFGYEVASPQG